MTVLVTMPDGSVKEFAFESVLQDGTCLVRDGDPCFHTVVGCEGQFSCWHLTTIDEAKAQGKTQCWSCDRKIHELQDFDFGDDF